jgi:hypothetical protein
VEYNLSALQVIPQPGRLSTWEQRVGRMWRFSTSGKIEPKSGQNFAEQLAPVFSWWF